MNGKIVEPITSYVPAICKFMFVNGQAIMEQYIPLEAADGTPYSGRVNSDNPTGQTLVDLNGVPQPADANGYDSEGLVAMPDGTFYVSDEYGPYITHFDSTGKAISRLSPLDASLPAELRNRLPNRGMEGLTITPDGTMLVGMMQAALNQPDNLGKNFTASVAGKGVAVTPSARARAIEARTAAAIDALFERGLMPAVRDYRLGQ